MLSFWRSRDRFSLDELKDLNEQLQRTTSINETNKDSIVETLRSIAELLIWGDQHEPLFFEYFMEKQMMANFLRILKNSRCTSVTIQLLQTLNIMVQSMGSQQSLYYLFSNEHINNLITFPFHFQDEELIAYYISLLRVISTKLDKSTVSFFVKTQNSAVVEFPLYTEAIKFAHHEESMVRIAVRTLTLHVYNIDDPAIQKFIVSQGQVEYFVDLVVSLRQQTFKLMGAVTDLAKNPGSLEANRNLEEIIAETGDILSYCNDIINAGIRDLSTLMTKHIIQLLVVPVLIPSLHPYEITEMQTKELSSLYLFSCLFQVVNDRDLVCGIAIEMLTQDSKNLCESSSCRDLIISYLLSGNDKLVLASLNVLVAMLQNQSFSETMLDTLGILPQHKHYKKLLLEPQVGNNTPHEVPFASLTIGDGDASGHPMVMTNKKEYINVEPCMDENGSKKSPRKNRYQVFDALMRLLCRRPSASAEVLLHAGWLMVQLLPYNGQKLLVDQHLQMLNKAYAAAHDDIINETSNCWCDLVPNLLSADWKACKKVLETSVIKKDTSSVLWQNPTSTLVTGDISSTIIGERMKSKVKAFVILSQLKKIVLQGSIPNVATPLGQPKDYIQRFKTRQPAMQLTAVKRESEIDLRGAIPCRISFEKGKERSMYLVVYLEGIAGWLLLAEDLPLKPRMGIIRVIAPLAGSNPRVDEKHPKWLHLRIRSPHPPTSDGVKPSTGRTSTKRIGDGRWTLAFPDEKTCKYAQTVVLEELEIQSSAVRDVLQPFFTAGDRTESAKD